MNSYQQRSKTAVGRLLLALLLLIPLGVNAQSVTTITGLVKDGQGEPLIGASVVQKGTSNGTITDLDGHFKVQVPAGATLVISYVGFSEKEVKAAPNLSVTLQDKAKAID